MSSIPKKHLIQIGVDEEAFDKLKKCSDAECRSITGTVMYALRKFISEEYGDDTSNNG